MKIEGKNAVTECISSGKTIEKIIIQNGIDAKNIIDLARDRGIKIQFANKSALDDLSVTKKHQGIIALTSDFVYSSVEDILQLSKQKSQPAFILILDGIEDPHNLGSIIRVAECAGVDGIIIPKDRAVGVNETVVKVSAGATERVKVAKVVNLNRTIEDLKKHNIFVYAADMDGDTMYQTNLKGDIALIIGSEGFGVSKLTRKLADGIISIPMYGKINSLNASVSAGVVVYEIIRQRSF